MFNKLKRFFNIPSNAMDDILLTRYNDFMNLYMLEIASWKNCDTVGTCGTSLQGTVLRGIVLGDIAGSIREGGCCDGPLFQGGSTFSDDTVMTIAVMRALREIQNSPSISPLNSIKTYIRHMRSLAKQFPEADYGYHFRNWALNDYDDPEYESYGNGGAMRAGIIGAMCPTMEETIKQTIMATIPTHAHPEGVKGAVATAGAVWLAAHLYSKEAIKDYVLRLYPCGYKTMEEYNQMLKSKGSTYMSPEITIGQLQDLIGFSLSVKSQIAVPEAFANFFCSNTYEGCIMNMTKYICDGDTVAAISGGIAAALYGDTSINGYDTTQIIKDIIPAELLKLI